MRHSQASTTLRQPLEHRPGVSEWFDTTQILFNTVAAFYAQVLDAHPAVLELSAKDALSALERLTHTTADNPHPVMPLAPLATQVPALFRRAAIHAALGAMRSFQTHLTKWKRAQAKAVAKGKRCRLRPPVPPRTWTRSVVFYAGMWKQAAAGRIYLKLYDGTTWRWVRFRMQGGVQDGPGLEEGWERGSPQAVRHGNRWWLHIPRTRDLPRPAPVVTQLTTDAPPLLCAVDLNLGDAQAVCTIQNVDGTVVATRFLRGGDELHGRRKSLLGRIARNRRTTGLLAEGEHDNTTLWAKIRHLDEYAAHRLSRRIVDFAQSHGAAILVFEHLESLRPERGRYSRRANAKRAYWLKARIFRYARYKAWNGGVLTCRVNPKNTSRLCARCGAVVVRYAAGQPRAGYQPGAPLAWCAACERTVHADVNASRNIGQRLVARCRQDQQGQVTAPATTQEKPPTVLARGQASKGAGGARPHVAAGPGRRVGHGTA